VKQWNPPDHEIHSPRQKKPVNICFDWRGLFLQYKRYGGVHVQQHGKNVDRFHVFVVGAAFICLVVVEHDLRDTVVHPWETVDVRETGPWGEFKMHRHVVEFVLCSLYRMGEHGFLYNGSSVLCRGGFLAPFLDVNVPEKYDENVHETPYGLDVYAQHVVVYDLNGGEMVEYCGIGAVIQA